MMNWWAQSAASRYHLETIDCGWHRQDAECICARTKAKVEQIGAGKVGIVTDRASTMRKARRLLKEFKAMAKVFWGWCGEHVGQCHDCRISKCFDMHAHDTRAAHIFCRGNTLAEKLRKIFPWMKDAVSDVRHVTVYQSRKKKLRSYCKELVLRSDTPRKITLRRPRSTRFCSHHTSAMGLLYNLKALQDGTARAGVRDVRFQEVFGRACAHISNKVSCFGVLSGGEWQERGQCES